MKIFPAPFDTEKWERERRNKQRREREQQGHLKRCLDEAAAAPHLTRQTERDLFARLMAGSSVAEDDLVRAYQRLVIEIAQKYRNRLDITSALAKSDPVMLG